MAKITQVVPGGIQPHPIPEIARPQQDQLPAEGLESSLGVASTAEIQDSSHTPQKPTILFVDDEEPNRTMFKKILELKGYNVLLANDGVEALKILREVPHIKLLCSDTDMPNMGGIELTRIVNQEFPSLPVILLSGRMKNLRLDGSLIGLSLVDTIQKPDELFTRFIPQVKRIIEEQNQ